MILFCDSANVHHDNLEFIKLAFEANVALVAAPKKISNTVKLPFCKGVVTALKDKWYEELDEMQLSVTPEAPVSCNKLACCFWFDWLNSCSWRGHKSFRHLCQHTAFLQKN